MTTITESITVRCEPYITEDPRDIKHHGTQTGLDYSAGEGVGLVEAHVGDLSYGMYPWVDVWLNGFDATKLEHIEAALPNLIALVNDPRIQAAKAAFAAFRATVPPEALTRADEAMDRKKRLLYVWGDAFKDGHKHGLAEMAEAVRCWIAAKGAAGAAENRVMSLVNEIDTPTSEPTSEPPTLSDPYYEPLELRGVTPEGVSAWRGCFVSECGEREPFLRLEYRGIYLDLYDNINDREPIWFSFDSSTQGACRVGEALTADNLANLSQFFLRAQDGIQRWLAEREHGNE